jgi:glycosyltransferase involved in cell wall biosynthesis
MLKKKVCWVVASPLTIKFFLLGHIETLAKACDLTVITHTEDPHFLDYLGVPLRVIPLTIERNVSLWRDFKALIQLIWIFRREKFDLVHSLSPKSGLLAMVAARVARIPLRLHTFQGEVWVTRKGLWRTILKNLDVWMTRCATHLLVVSRSEEQFLIAQHVVAPGQLTMLGNGSICGVDLSRFKPDADIRNDMRNKLGISVSDKVILYVGRLNRDKGLLDLADAYADLGKRHHALHLLVVGPDEEDLRNQIRARANAADSMLHFADYTASPERYMAAADMLCLPSYREGFGLVLIEAAATGLPTVGSRIYGISDAVADNETGLLFESGNVAELTRKIELLVTDTTLAKSLGDAGLTRARRDFDRELVLSEFMKYYKHILQD